MKSKILVSVLTVLTGLFLYTSCTKLDTTNIGSDLIPAVDNVNTFDTVLDVVTDNYLFDDSTRPSKSSDHVLGVIDDDPEFGKTTAGIYLSLSPASYGFYPFTNKDSVILDSVVLSLSYQDAYGDSMSMQQFEVHEIDPNGDFVDSAYLLRTPAFALAPDLLGSKLVNFNTLHDSVTYVNAHDTIHQSNELRIPLDTNFARRFVNYDTATQYKNDSLFKLSFKGLAVTVNEGASPVKKALAYFSLTDNNRTKLTFYYRVQNNGKTDTTYTTFAYYYGAHANLIERTPAHDYLNYVNNGHNDNDDKVYLQSTPGSYATIRVPGLSGLSNRVIHKAQLIMEPVASQDDDVYTAPQLLFLDGYDSSAQVYRTIQNDFYQLSSGYNFSDFGGYLRNGQYTFDLSRYVQGIVTRGEKNLCLRLYAPYSATPVYLPQGKQADYDVLSLKESQSAVGFSIFVNSQIANGRVVLAGGSHPANKMKLRIIYSKI